MDESLFFDRLVGEGIELNAVAIARIFLAGDLALLFFEIGESDAALSGARALGWNGARVQVRSLNKPQVIAWAQIMTLAEKGPTAVVTWLASDSGDQLLASSHDAIFCFDHIDDSYTLAPGTFEKPRARSASYLGRAETLRRRRLREGRNFRDL